MKSTFLGKRKVLKKMKTEVIRKQLGQSFIVMRLGHLTQKQKFQ